MIKLRLSPRQLGISDVSCRSDASPYKAAAAASEGDAMKDLFRSVRQ
jgi:hypothetical protein